MSEKAVVVTVAGNGNGEVTIAEIIRRALAAALISNAEVRVQQPAVAKNKEIAVKYLVTVPFQDDMGSIVPFVATGSPHETVAQNALWTINNMRDHDCLQRLTRLPSGTKIEPIEEDYAPSSN